MSKKIIYLLSLLMALSLVFASCKKNNPLDAGGGLNAPPEVDNTPSTGDGLYDSAEDLANYNNDAIKNEPILTSKSGLYFRNPVVVVMGANHNQVVVISEKRHEANGSGNDIGVNGNIATDIVYLLSENSGGRFDTTEGTTVAKAGAAATDGNGKVGYAAPVVFKVSDTKLVVVASSGGGISRSSQEYSSRPDYEKSKLVYAVGEIKGSKIEWSSDWKDMTTTVSQAIDGDSAVQSYKQFGTHSARGFTTGTGDSITLYLPITVAIQGTTANTQEKMGNIFFKATVTASTLSPSSPDITWTKMDKSAAFDVSGNYSTFKESRIISGTTDGDIRYIAVANPTPGNYKVGVATIGSKPSASTIDGSEGSPAYLKVANWQGTASYDPATYVYDSGNAKSMFMHVTGQDKNLTFYLLQDVNFAPDGKGILFPAPKTGALDAKSSSMDVLGDGTIIMVAEQDGGGKRDYKVIFKRFSQYYLATQVAK